MSRDLKDLLGSGEGVVLETRQHWFVVVKDIAVRMLILLLIAVAVWYVGDAGWLDNRPGEWLGYAGWIGFGVVSLTILWTVAGWVTERFYVTTQRVVYAHGILNRSVTTTPLVKIDEMTLQRPLLGRMLGYGRLDVENASGGHEPLAGLEFLPTPVRIYQTIGERSRHQRMHEGGNHPDRDNDGLVDAEEAPRPPAAPAPTPAPAPASTEDRGDDGDWKPSGDSTSGV